MARLQKESRELMTFRLREMSRLKERIAGDEARTDEIIGILMERDTSEKSQETDALILELNSISVRVERDKAGLAKLKSPSELTEEDKRYLTCQRRPERYNIKY